MDAAKLASEVAAAPELSATRLAELTSRFVAVPSVNGEHPERDIARVIANELQPFGYELQFVGSEHRPSLGVRTPGDSAVLLNGHTDTVPVDDADSWKHDPFSGVVADGSVHGRGACDMKGGLAIQVAVAQWLASRAEEPGLVLHFAMGEERGEPGTADLLDAGFVAPVGIVLEPTDLQLGIAQRGLVTLVVNIEGRAGHASRPELTENPIASLHQVLEVVRRLDSEPTRSHSLLGSPKWTPTMVDSGVIPSMVPGTCVLHVDRRSIPGESVEAIVADLQRALDLAGLGSSAAVSIAEEEGIYEPAEIERDADVVETMSQALEACGEEVKVFGTPYSSDIRHLINDEGISAITYGPGRASDMHARDEHILIDDLLRAARVVALFSSISLSPTD